MQISRTHLLYMNMGVVGYTGNLDLGRQRQKDSWGYLAIRSSQMGELQ